jgi:hypothetical protein
MIRSLLRLAVLIALIWAAVHYWHDIEGIFSHHTRTEITHIVGTVKSDYHTVRGVASKL